MAKTVLTLQNQGKPHPFTGGMITVKQQTDQGAVTVETLPPPARSPEMDGHANFTLIRLIVDLKLTKASAIDFPARLRVNLTSGDIHQFQAAEQAAKQAGKAPPSLKMAYWDKSQKRWVMLIKAASSLAEGYIEADYSKVGDPPIAVGP